ncbi:hypothetical protein [uncultured Desulfosarcina sp.]|uniref:hypothetical protein n=1 Tax=uncultured Desulfosarcina sp. TaxID=218289 RepID=UPI0029C86E6A|nr:hypothetical protein [uncultured Desulfosarcina sp.]
MTIRLPQRNILDYVLRLFGKRRAIVMPREVIGESGPYSTIVARKESFFTALLRPRNRKLPDGFVYMEDFYESVKLP